MVKTNMAKTKIIIWILAGLFLIFNAMATTQYELVSDGSSDGQWFGKNEGAGTYYILGTNFSLNNSQNLEKLSIYVRDCATLSGSVELQLRGDTSGAPTNNTLLANGSVTCATGWINATMTSTVTMAANTPYWITITSHLRSSEVGHAIIGKGTAITGTRSGQNVDAAYLGVAWTIPTASSWSTRIYYSEATQNITLNGFDEWNGTATPNLNTTLCNGATCYTYSNSTGNKNTAEILSNSTLLWNITAASTNYFNRTYLNQNISAGSLNLYLHQAEICFNATNKIAGQAVTANNYSISSNYSANCFNISAGSHTVLFQKTGWQNKTQAVAITALSNTTATVTGAYYARWNLTVYNLINASVVTTYDINISSLNYTWAGENSSSATGSYVFLGINGTYTATIDAPGYVITSFNFTIGGTTGGANFSLYTTNSINITIYDEETRAVLTGPNITLEFIGLSVYNFSTTNGTYYADLLSPYYYLIRYDADGYAERFYFFNLTNRTTNTLTLYLLNETTTGYATITNTVYDETNNELESAIIKVLRYYLDLNSYVIVEMCRTNFEGVCILHLKQNEEFYKFIIEYPAGTTKKETQQTQIYATTLNFQILLTNPTGQKYYKSQGVELSLTFDETTNTFRLYWNDAANTLSQMCLITDQLTNFRNTTINNTCQSGSTGIIYHVVNNITGYTYAARAMGYFSTPPVPMAGLLHTFTATNPIGAIGLFILILVTLTFSLIAYWSIPVAVVLAPLPTMLFSIAGLIKIPAYVTVPVEIIAVIIAYVISTRA